MRRSPWINERVALLLAQLEEWHFTLPEDVARQAISDHVDYVAMVMRIGRQAAKFYVTDDAIVSMARRIADGVKFTSTGNPLILVRDDEQ